MSSYDIIKEFHCAALSKSKKLEIFYFGSSMASILRKQFKVYKAVRTLKIHNNIQMFVPIYEAAKY